MNGSILLGKKKIKKEETKMISFRRNGKWIDLQEFNPELVTMYLVKMFGDDIKVREDNGVYGRTLTYKMWTHFEVKAEQTSIQITYYSDEEFYLQPVFDAIKNWERFTSDIVKYYFVLNIKRESGKLPKKCVIFENGAVSKDIYTSKYHVLGEPPIRFIEF
jgi:hypothetical protein